MYLQYSVPVFLYPHQKETNLCHPSIPRISAIIYVAFFPSFCFLDAVMVIQLSGINYLQAPRVYEIMQTAVNRQ
jgi:hypothetical protein